MSKKCKHCEWWSKESHPHETFRLLNWEWDVTEGEKLAPIQVGEIATDKVAVLVDYPINEGSFSITKVSVVEEHLDHVDMNKPILFGLFTYAGKTTWNCIDGHHRIARAVRDNLPSLKYHLLSEEQMDLIALHK